LIRNSRRLTAAAVLALAGGLALSGCTTSPGAAAVVGNTSFSVDQLASMVHRAYTGNPQAAQARGSTLDFERGQLSRMVGSAVVRTAAQERGITVTNGEIDQQLKVYAQQAGGMKALEQQAERSGFAPGDLRGLVEDVLLQQKLGDKLVADVKVPDSTLRQLYEQHIDDYDQVRSAHILVKDKATADKILAEARKDPASFGALAKQYSTDQGSAANGGELGYAGRGQFVPAFADAIFAAKPGSIIEVHSQFGWHVVKVIARRTTTFAQAKPDLRRAYLQDQQSTLEAKVLSATAKRLGVHINPRFGRYDPNTNQVVARVDTLSKPLQSKPTAQPTLPLGG
jgi:parvulin-like peptidyl-prolyl isomerase